MVRGEAAQRWRLILERAPRETTQRDAELAWEGVLERSGLPVVRSTAGRRAPRILFAVPLSVGMTGAAEPAEILLEQRLREVDIRGALVDLPSGDRLLDLHDVWVGAPGLPSLVVAADYRVELVAGPQSSSTALERAIERLLGTVRIERIRPGSGRAYDLRPLVERLELLPALGPGADVPVLRMRLRHAGEAGTGRPDEVLAALGDAAGLTLGAAVTVRERVILSDE